uniref:Uncharacterized protein n=1 Tax=Oryza glumipatula TaxID=40148 RepID=A0A0D9YUL8_9ORYZ
MFAGGGGGLVVMPGRSGLSIPSLPCGADPGAANFFERPTTTRESIDKPLHPVLAFLCSRARGSSTGYCFLLLGCSWGIFRDSDRCLFIARCPGFPFFLVKLSGSAVWWLVILI